MVSLVDAMKPTLSNKFVPVCSSPSMKEIESVLTLMNRSNGVLALSGAGVSTESGIPDYRSPGIGLYATSNNRPVLYQDFISSVDNRQRYWARNYVGWPKFSSMNPNASHVIFKNLERLGKVKWLVTQNVDSLHFKAGSTKVTELHGTAHRVVCLGCNINMARTSMQTLMNDYNLGWHASSDAMTPDGDTTLTMDQVQGFKVLYHKKINNLIVNRSVWIFYA